MAINPKPWLIAGGVEHPIEVARALAHLATGGTSGVGTPSSMRVSALGTPGSAVQVAPGVAVADSSYSGAGNLQQSYVGISPSATQVPIAATGSTGGRSDLVVMRITDPQYEGSWPTDPQSGTYCSYHVIQGVPAGTKGTKGLGLSFPCAALARIDIPASTGAITGAMITDLRRLVNPRQQREVLCTVPAGDSPLNQSGKTKWTSWTPTVFVPEWATHFQVIATLSSLRVLGDAAGLIDVRINKSASSDLQYDFEQEAAGTTSRAALSVVGAGTVPSSWRETDVPLELYGTRAAGKTGVLSLNGTQIIYDVQFTERVV